MSSITLTEPHGVDPHDPNQADSSLRDSSLRDLDPSAEPPRSLAARIMRSFGWTTVMSASVTAATLVGMSLSVVCAVGVLIAGTLALVVVAALAVIFAAALLVLGALLVALAVLALALGAAAGVSWAALWLGSAIARVGHELWHLRRGGDGPETLSPA